MISFFNFHVNLVNNLVSQLIFRDDEHGQTQQDSRDDTYQPEDTLLSKRSLCGDLGIEPYIREYESWYHATQSHTGLEENTRQGIHDTRDTLTCGILTKEMTSGTRAHIYPVATMTPVDLMNWAT